MRTHDIKDKDKDKDPDSTLLKASLDTIQSEILYWESDVWMGAADVAMSEGVAHVDGWVADSPDSVDSHPTSELSLSHSSLDPQLNSNTAPNTRATSPLTPHTPTTHLPLPRIPDMPHHVPLQLPHTIPRIPVPLPPAHEPVRPASIPEDDDYDDGLDDINDPDDEFFDSDDPLSSPALLLGGNGYSKHLSGKPRSRKISETEYSRDDGSPKFDQKRTILNVLERARREDLKSSFVALRDSVPDLQGKRASKGQILKKAYEYLNVLNRQSHELESGLVNLRRENERLMDTLRKGQSKSAKREIVSN